MKRQAFTSYFSVTVRSDDHVPLLKIRLLWYDPPSLYLSNLLLLLVTDVGAGIDVCAGFFGRLAILCSYDVRYVDKPFVGIWI